MDDVNIGSALVYALLGVPFLLFYVIYIMIGNEDKEAERKAENMVFFAFFVLLIVLVFLWEN